MATAHPGRTTPSFWPTSRCGDGPAHSRHGHVQQDGVFSRSHQWQSGAGGGVIQPDRDVIASGRKGRLAVARRWCRGSPRPASRAKWGRRRQKAGCPSGPQPSVRWSLPRLSGRERRWCSRQAAGRRNASREPGRAFPPSVPGHNPVRVIVPPRESWRGCSGCGSATTTADGGPPILTNPNVIMLPACSTPSTTRGRCWAWSSTSR